MGLRHTGDRTALVIAAIHDRSIQLYFASVGQHGPASRIKAGVIFHDFDHGLDRVDGFPAFGKDFLASGQSTLQTSFAGRPLFVIPLRYGRSSTAVYCDRPTGVNVRLVRFGLAQHQKTSC